MIIVLGEGSAFIMFQRETLIFNGLPLTPKSEMNAQTEGLHTFSLDYAYDDSKSVGTFDSARKVFLESIKEGPVGDEENFDIDEMCLAPNGVSYEMFYDHSKEKYVEIIPKSQNWEKISETCAFSLVVRLKTLCSFSETQHIVEWMRESLPFKKKSYCQALHVVGKFKEISVAKGSPVLYEICMLFLFEQSTDYDEISFSMFSKDFLSRRCVPQKTTEALQSFLTRRLFAHAEIDSSVALEALKRYVYLGKPCSSLFLKMSAHFPHECLLLLDYLHHSNQGNVMDIIGERALHKLAVSVINKQVCILGVENDAEKAMHVMGLGNDPSNWGFVAFNTLVRLSQEDQTSSPRYDERINMIIQKVSESNSDIYDKVSIYLMAEKAPVYLEPRVKEIYDRLMYFVSCKGDERSEDDLYFTLALLDNNQTVSSSHVLSIILKLCSKYENFNAGWKLATLSTAISKQVFGEVVALCCKAYFSTLALGSDIAEVEQNRWFQRIDWCIRRHVAYLNRYPCGLALHVSAHRRKFHKTWEWFCAMRQALSFRLTGYHTSAVLKSASFEDKPSSEMLKVKEAYELTLPQERTTFIFIPLVRIYDSLRHRDRSEHFEFWEMVHLDLKNCIDSSKENMSSHSLKNVILKLEKWQFEWVTWKNLTNNGKHIPESMNRQEKRTSKRYSKKRGSNRDFLRKNRGSFQTSFSSDGSERSIMPPFLRHRLAVSEATLSSVQDSSNIKSRTVGSERSNSISSSSNSIGSISRRGSLFRFSLGDSSVSFQDNHAKDISSQIRRLIESETQSIW